MVRNQQFGSNPTHLVDLRAFCYYCDSCFNGCLTGDGEPFSPDLNHAQSASTKWLQVGVITEMWDVNSVFQCSLEYGISLVCCNLYPVDGKADLLHHFKSPSRSRPGMHSTALKRSGHTLIHTPHLIHLL